MTVRYEPDGSVVVVTIDRPEVRNAVDPKTAALLVESFWQLLLRLRPEGARARRRQPA